MGSIGIQTDIEIENREGSTGFIPYHFICIIKNEEAATQCYLPHTSDAATCTSEKETDLMIIKNDDEEPPKKRGRPKKKEQEINDNLDNNTNGMPTVRLPRIRRERKIPIKFDPSDMERTKDTSHSLQTSFKHEDGSHMECILNKMRCDEVIQKSGNVTPLDDKIQESVTQPDGSQIKVMTRNFEEKRSLSCARVRRRKDKGPYNCEHCGQSFKIHSIFSRHIRTHESMQDLNSYPCRVCGKLLSSSINLKRHMMIHSGKPFICNRCGKTFTGRYLLKEHLVIEHNEVVKKTQKATDYQCHSCMKYMSSKSALEYHQAVKHLCPKCETTWPCKKSLRDHLLEVHDEAKVTEDGHLICNQCSKTFVYRNNYLNHMAQHSNEKPHECPKCSKFFNTSQALYCHNKQVHEKHKFRHPCSMCEKVFICKAKLVEHIRTHTGEKPFACHECKVAFAAKATLKTHINLIHKLPSNNSSKNKHKSDPQCKYNCPLCDKVDLKSTQLESHFLKVHNATVQFSNSIPADVPDDNIVIVDGTKDIVLLQGEAHSPVSEESKEIVLSEGTSEVIVLNGSSEKILSKQECSEIMVTEETV